MQVSPVGIDGDDEDLQTEIQFAKCKDGVPLFREESARSSIIEGRTEPRPKPLSPTSKAKEMVALSETISSMAKLRMNDQRCSLSKV